MPTANRPQFVEMAIRYFQAQDYSPTELIIVDDGTQSIFSLVPNQENIKYFTLSPLTPIGAKRNYACEQATGEIIVHWDDDDWYANDWVAYQVKTLLGSNADICGLSEINFYSIQDQAKWTYRNNKNKTPWVYGGTLAYWRSFWVDHPFVNMQKGEDNEFVLESGANVFSHNYTNGYICILHGGNIGIQPLEDPREKVRMLKWILRIYKPEPRIELTPPPITRTRLPLVSCIMPTANRDFFIPDAIDNFLKQNYPNKELIIIDDGDKSISELIPKIENIKYYYYNDPLGKLGSKRNLACEKARGKIIMHWDDDDWYAPDWISYQVTLLKKTKTKICGLNQVIFHSAERNTYKMTKNQNSKFPWLSGATLAYWKSFWEKHPFEDLQIKEDDKFVRSAKAKVFAHDYYDGFIATLHPKNTSIKQFEDPKTKRQNP